MWPTQKSGMARLALSQRRSVSECTLAVRSAICAVIVNHGRSFLEQESVRRCLLRHVMLIAP